MTEEERALRIMYCLEHHAAFGVRIENDDLRSRCFLNDTACIPIDIFAAALRRARQCHESTFPPSAGQVVAEARKLCWDRDPHRYRNPTNGGISNPRWYNRMLRGLPAQYLALAPGEQAKEIA